MKAIRIAATALIIGAVVCGCGKKGAEKSDAKGAKAGAKLDTVEKFTAEYKKCHAKGADALLGLVYKKDLVPEKFAEMMKMSLKDDASQTIKEITTEKYDDSGDAATAKAMEKQGYKMPSTPTDNMKVAFEPQEAGGVSETTYTIGKIDGSYYLLAPHKIK